MGSTPRRCPSRCGPDVADHVAAVVLFGAPNARAMNFLGAAAASCIGPLYAGKTIQVCVPDDPVCSDGLEFAADNATRRDEDGVVDEGADFAASRL